MGKPVFIGGDWGTSRLRLYLCDGDGAVLARADGPGIAEAGADCAHILADLAAPWDARHGKLPMVLCGMVGSTLGWREVAYVACPAGCERLARAALRFDSQGRDILLMPGLSCRNKSGVFDVMRGEETQIAGALRLFPDLGAGRHLFCLPGTHAKWADVTDGAVTQFQTALSGELFDLVVRHSVLARDSGPACADDDAFVLGLRLAAANRDAGVLHLLFSTRSRQLGGEIAAREAASYLSGLVIGDDVAGALALFAPRDRVLLVCAPALAAPYARALEEAGLTTLFIDGDAAARAGLAGLRAALCGDINV